jgi:F0F1-type ATP synthase assembly protein I
MLLLTILRHCCESTKFAKEFKMENEEKQAPVQDRNGEMVSTAYQAGKNAGETESFNKGFVAGVVITCLIGWFFKGGN